MGALQSPKREILQGGGRPKVAAAFIIDFVESGGLMYDGLHSIRLLDFSPDNELFVLMIKL